MVFKKIILLFLLLSSIFAFSQEEIITFKNDLKTSYSYLKGVVPIVNNKNDDISLFLVDSKKIYGYLLDKNFNIINKLISEDKSRKYKITLGSRISSKNNYYLYVANKKLDKFAFLKFSFNKNKSSFKEFDLESTDEILIQTITNKNKFYLLTIVKNSSILKIYSFNDDGYFINKIDFSTDIFFNKSGKNVSFYKLLSASVGSFGLNKRINIVKIDDNNPNPLEITSELIKLYFKNDKIIFSFDINNSFTQVISIDINTFDKQLKHFNKPLKEIELNQKKTNSYINNNSIYLIAFSSKKFTLSIVDFATGELIIEYTASVDRNISFKNTSIIQEGGMYNNYREMEKTKRFFRKIMSEEKVGVSVHEFKNSYQITIGGKRDFNYAPTMMPIPFASIGVSAIYFNPIGFSYSSYSDTKSTYFKSILDLNYNHVDGKIQENAFDKIKKYKALKAYLDNSRIIFKYKDYYILGDFYHQYHEYDLRKFKDSSAN
jgi:hypothetical protein